MRRRMTCRLLLGIIAFASAPSAFAQAEDILIVEKNLGAADGFPAAFTPEVVKDMDRGFRDGALESIREKGLKIEPDVVRASSEVVRWKSRDVLRTTLTALPAIFTIQYIGEVKGEVLMVICVSGNGQPFDLPGSECEQRAQNVFSR